MRNIRIPQVFTLIQFYQITPQIITLIRISANYKEDKTKATSNFHCLSPSVGMRRLERPTPTSRT